MQNVDEESGWDPHEGDLPMDGGLWSKNDVKNPNRKIDEGMSELDKKLKKTLNDSLSKSINESINESMPIKSSENNPHAVKYYSPPSKTKQKPIDISFISQMHDNIDIPSSMSAPPKLDAPPALSLPPPLLPPPPMIYNLPSVNTPPAVQLPPAPVSEYTTTPTNITTNIAPSSLSYSSSSSEDDDEDDDTLSQKEPTWVKYSVKRPIIIPLLKTANGSAHRYMPSINKPGLSSKIAPVEWRTNRREWSRIYTAALGENNPAMLIYDFSEAVNYKVIEDNVRPLKRIETLLARIEQEFQQSRNQIGPNMLTLCSSVRKKLAMIIRNPEYTSLELNMADPTTLSSTKYFRRKYRNIARNIEYVLAYCLIMWTTMAAVKKLNINVKDWSKFYYIVDTIDTCNWSQIHQKIDSQTIGMDTTFKYGEIKTYLDWYFNEKMPVNFCEIKRLKTQNSFGNIELKQDKSLIYGGVIMDSLNNFMALHGKKVLVAIVVILVLYLVYTFVLKPVAPKESISDNKLRTLEGYVPISEQEGMCGAIQREGMCGDNAALREGLRGFSRENMCGPREGYVPISEQEGMCGGSETFHPRSALIGEGVVSSFCESKDTRMEGMTPTGRLDLSGLRNFVADLSRSEGYTENALNNTEIDNTRSFVEGSGGTLGGKVLRSENLSSLDAKLRAKATGM